ncbi:hypothetical protein AK812_SmicGene30988 [Symbiodinium microadriaticum]|uniref:Uncharacterized protein n=1 Tax=Symbiodinium microadriaticum TaxID=2951 RepID=A0A1Q9CY00_SYMMI|nr:hypothetical protein AK812_SmicGene30988 [Symbiodinium microadriaticum]
MSASSGWASGYLLMTLVMPRMSSADMNQKGRTQEFQRAYQMLAVLCGSTHQYTASPYNKLWQVTNGNSTNSSNTNGTADAVAESAKLA